MNEERTCQNCKHYWSGGYNFPCNECRQSGEWWAPIEEFPTKQLSKAIKDKTSS
jgi:hypothetical protein